MDRSEIQLELDPTTRQERLVGLNGEMVPDSRILIAVAANRRLFPHVVKHLALNQYTAKNPEYVHNDSIPPSQEMLDIMRDIRDGLIDGGSDFRCAETTGMVE